MEEGERVQEADSGSKTWVSDSLRRGIKLHHPFLLPAYEEWKTMCTEIHSLINVCRKK
jgi:hypothetical protein